MIRPYTSDKDVRPYYPAVVDIETDRRTGDEFAVIWSRAADDPADRDPTIYPSWDAFWPDYVAYASRQRCPVRERYLYAHNGGGFDWPHLIAWMLREGVRPERIKIVMAEGIFIGADIRLNESKKHPVVIHLRDSIRLMPGSLAAITKAFKVAHQKIAIGDQLHHELARTDPDLFRRYCVNDVLGLQEAIHAFWTMLYAEVGSFGKLPMTLPALSLRLWRMHLTDPVLVPQYPYLRELERASYVGGRTECFRVGSPGNVKVYDVNSLYPSIMRDIDVPTSYAGGVYTKDYYDGSPGVFDCSFRQPDTGAKPVLRDGVSKEFRYSGRGVYTKPELDLLREHGGTVYVHSGWRYFKTGNLFRPFVERWYQRRLAALRDGNDGLAYVCKILMNSLYGKFGQREDGWTLYVEPYGDTYRRIQQGQEVRILGDFVAVKETRRNDATFVGIASYITAAARVALYRAIEAAERAGGYVWYCDTDSVHVSGADLPTGDGLGELKLEYDGPARYAGKKLYELVGEKMKHKGVPAKRELADGTKVPTVASSDMAALVAGDIDGIAATYATLPTPKEVLLRGAPPAVAIDRKRTLRVTGPR